MSMLRRLFVVLLSLSVGGLWVACGAGDYGSYNPGGDYNKYGNQETEGKSRGTSPPPQGPADAGTSHHNSNSNTSNPNTNTNNTTTPPPVNNNNTAKVNPWTDPRKDNLSTFAIDVDTASYTYSRRMLREQGVWPSPNSVRVEEFVNFFDYNYEGPKEAPFKLHVDGAVSPFNKEHHILRVGIQGKRMKPAERKSMHLTFLIDTSCSMTGGDRIGLVKASLNILVGEMRDGDTVAIATYAGGTRKVLEPTDASKQSVIRSAINSLGTGGGTAMSSGMILAYEMASKSFVKGHENRVIVLSDGDANIGRTSFTEILATIEKYVKQGITMTTVGFGTGNYRDNRMEQLANKGNGNYYYVDNEDQARRVFRDKFISTMLTIAKDVKIQVEFDPDYINSYRLIGYENRDIADKDFRNDKVDAGELGSGHNVTALYEVKMNKDKVMPLVQSKSTKPLITVRLRFKAPHSEADAKASEVVFPVPGINLYRDINASSWQTQWATAVMGFAEILRRSPLAEGWTLEQVEQLATKAKQSDDYHKEFLELLGIAKKLNTKP